MKKKTNDILKGVAGAGIALGGAAAFGEMDVIYAAEYESEQSELSEMENVMASETPEEEMRYSTSERRAYNAPSSRKSSRSP